MDDLPLQSYAIIGNSRTAALISSHGSLDWFCWPRFDGPAVLCRLLDRERGGYLSVRPRGAFRARRAYLPDTNVLELEFETCTGLARARWFMRGGPRRGARRAPPCPLDRAAGRVHSRDDRAGGPLQAHLRLRAGGHAGRRGRGRRGRVGRRCVPRLGDRRAAASLRRGRADGDAHPPQWPGALAPAVRRVARFARSSGGPAGTARTGPGANGLHLARLGRGDHLRRALPTARAPQWPRAEAADVRADRRRGAWETRPPRSASSTSTARSSIRPRPVSDRWVEWTMSPSGGRCRSSRTGPHDLA
jgi:hypothetical protein